MRRRSAVRARLGVAILLATSVVRADSARLSLPNRSELGAFVVRRPCIAVGSPPVLDVFRLGPLSLYLGGRPVSHLVSTRAIGASAGLRLSF